MIRNIPDMTEQQALVALQHHEREDGSGYPKGLKGKDILIGAKIIAVADVFEAMVSHRPYRPAKSIEQAITELESNKGKLFDSLIVDTCIEIIKEKGLFF